MRFFFFGTLRDRDLLEIVLDRTVPGDSVVKAWLPGRRPVRLEGETYPVLVPAAERHVEGRLVQGLGEWDLDRILFFESVEYAPQQIEVLLEDGSRVEAKAFLGTARARHSEEGWDFAEWQRLHKSAEIRIARIWMALHGVLSVEEADRLWDEIVAAGRPLEDMVRVAKAGARERKRA